MKLRLRGAIWGDLDWQHDRVPAVMEMLQLNDTWFRVVNVFWAVRMEGTEYRGYDVALVLQASPAPSREGWAEKPGTQTELPV